jgi:hypothetical protein
MTKVIPVVANNGFSHASCVESTMATEIAAPRRAWQQGIGLNRAAARVNADQLTSLSAMIAYVASKSGKSEFGIERNLADRFGVPNAKMLASSNFEDAIRYLVDTMPAS